MMTLKEASVIQPHRPTDGTSIWSISNNEKNSGKERPSPNECKTRHYYITAVRTAVRSDCPFLNEMNPTTRQEERASDAQLPTHFAATATQTPKARTTPRNFNCTRITQIQFVLTNLTTKNGRSGLCLQGSFMKFIKPSDPHGAKLRCKISPLDVAIPSMARLSLNVRPWNHGTSQKKNACPLPT